MVVIDGVYLQQHIHLYEKENNCQAPELESFSTKLLETLKVAVTERFAGRPGRGGAGWLEENNTDEAAKRAWKCLLRLAAGQAIMG